MPHPASQVAATVNFARRNNIRLVIKSTGPDLLGRSDGHGSLEVWNRHLRTGVTIHDSYGSSCSKTTWGGSALMIGGGYAWKDVCPFAKEHNVVVVGSGTPTVGCLRGWMQGGGHGPASRQYGLGAHHVLSAEVVLADGSIVTASPCEYLDVYSAIRGGGGGTHGVVTSTTIKAWPMIDVQTQQIAIAPLTDNTSALLDAVAILYAAYPDLNDAGFAGYGSCRFSPTTRLDMLHGFFTFNQSVPAAQAAFAPTLEKLLPFNMTDFFISVSYVKVAGTAATQTTAPSTTQNQASSLQTATRPPWAPIFSFSRADVQNDAAAFRHMIGIIAGTPEQHTSNNSELVSGGQVFADVADPYSSVNPAWRISHFNNMVARGWALNASQEDRC